MDSNEIKSQISKPRTTRRRFITGAVATAVMAGGTYGGYSIWRSRGEAAYEAHVAQSRRALNVARDQSNLFSEIVRFATLAPNSHNTQPWRFTSVKDSLTIAPDFLRRCPAVDPDDHHLWISLGAACENAILTARAVGRRPNVTIESVDNSIRLDLEKQTPEESDLFRAIPLRQTSRCPFDGTRLSSTELQTLKSACQDDDVEVRFFTERTDLDRIQEFVIQGNLQQMADAAFMRELKQWLRFSYRDAVDSGDGLFGKCSSQPVLPTWLASTLIDFVFTPAAETAKYESQLQSSAGVAVFVAREESPSSWIQVGRCFQRFALQATALGVLNSHLNQPVEVPATRREFASWLGIGQRRPDLIIRFGKGKQVPFSLRRSVGDVLKRETEPGGV